MARRNLLPFALLSKPDYLADRAGLMGFDRLEKMDAGLRGGRRETDPAQVLPFNAFGPPYKGAFWPSGTVCRLPGRSPFICTEKLLDLRFTSA